MQGRDLFGVLVRAGGVTFLVFAAFDLFHLLAKALEIALPSTVSAGADAIAMTWYLVLGLILFLRADWIVARAYRE